MSGRTKLYFILPFLIFVVGFTSNAYGQVVEPITVSIDKSSYYEGETILISGEVSEILFGYAVSVMIIAPNGDVISIDQAIVDSNKKFQTQLSAGGQLMNEIGSGMYTIRVIYGTENRTASTSFQYISSDTTQPFITISTDKSTYKENGIIYVTYAISKRIPYENLTIKLYDPNSRFISSNIITDYDLSSYSTSMTPFIPEDLRWDVGGIYRIIAEYANYSDTLSVEIITSDTSIPPIVNDTPTKDPKIIDKDDDGVPDSKDLCPSYTEDYNGYLDDDGCPDVPRIKPPFQKELLNGDEYIPIVYSFDFTKTPLIGISIEENDFGKLHEIKTSVEKGVKMWTIPLEQKFGGDWSVNFVLIPSQTQLQLIPDIIFNIQIVESMGECGHQAKAFQSNDFDPVKKIYKAKIPVNINHCYTIDSLDPELFSWLSQKSYEPTNAHEFFHALGFGHTYNKELDFMCGATGGVTCPPSNPEGYPIEEYAKGKIISDFDLTAIAYLYGVDGFQNPNKPVLNATKFTADDYLNFDASTYTIIPIPEMEETMKSKILRPLQQISMGISPEDVSCKDDFKKLYKSSGIPICVTKSSAEKLISRGWAQ